MTSHEERTIQARYKVIVYKMSGSDNSKCDSKGCKKHDTYTLFVGEESRLSTLFAGSCKDHLAKFVDKAQEERWRLVKKMVRAFKKEERRKAKLILNIEKQ